MPIAGGEVLTRRQAFQPWIERRAVDIIQPDCTKNGGLSESRRIAWLAYAGRTLTLNREVYQSEAATNQRNEGIANLLQSYDRIYFDPIQATDVYTKQCSLNVTVKDLAAMAATLANGGVNPLTMERIMGLMPSTASTSWPSW